METSANSNVCMAAAFANVTAFVLVATTLPSESVTRRYTPEGCVPLPLRSMTEILVSFVAPLAPNVFRLVLKPVIPPQLSFRV